MFSRILIRKATVRRVGNTTHGSGWIVQVQPTNESGSTASWNTTHGSGWIVQAHPTWRGTRDSVWPSLPSQREGREITKRMGAGPHLL